MLTLAEVKQFLAVNSNCDDMLLQTLIHTADEYIAGAVGNGYDRESERAKVLSLIVIQDLYDNQGITEKASGTIRKLVNDFLLQLKLENSGEKA